MSAALDAAVAFWRTKRGPVVAAAVAKATANAQLQAAGQAFDDLNIAASSDAVVGAALVLIEQRQAAFNAASLDLETKQSELQQARAAMIAQAKLDAGV